MIRISKLLTGKLNKKQEISLSSIKKQRLAVATAVQILYVYPKKRKAYTHWEKYRYLHGVLLADDVGGGKTFEALSIVCQAFLSIANNKRKRFRILILAEPAIRSKWEWKQESNKKEWCDLKKFIEQTALSKKKKEILKSFLKTAKEENIIKSSSKWKNKNNLNQGIWISSFRALPNTKGKKIEAKFKQDRNVKFPDNYFDYIIADEAHIVKSGYIDSDENISTSMNNRAIRKIYALLNHNVKAKLILLTATPFQNNLNELIHMLSLVETPNDLNLSIIDIATKGLKKLHQEIELIKSENDISKDKIRHLIKSFDNEVGNLIDEEISDTIRPKAIRNNGRKNGLDDFLRDLMVRNIKEPLDIISNECSLSNDEKLQYLLLRDLVSNKQDEEKEMVSVKLSQLVSSEKAFSNSMRNKRQKGKHSTIIKLFKNKNLVFDKKFNALLDMITQKKVPNYKKVLVVFCRFIPTIEILEKKLSKIFTSKNVFRLDGRTVKTKDRKKYLEEVADRNNESNEKIIFLVSQVGNEGLDFDKFSDTIIHFDGHYNPAVIDQRNGRVYRRGNHRKDITVNHIFLKDTYDQRIKFIELEKRRMKNFYLGDSGLELIIKKILSGKNIKEEKALLKELEKIKFDFEPKKKYLLPNVSKLL